MIGSKMYRLKRRRKRRLSIVPSLRDKKCRALAARAWGDDHLFQTLGAGAAPGGPEAGQIHAPPGRPLA